MHNNTPGCQFKSVFKHVFHLNRIHTKPSVKKKSKDSYRELTLVFVIKGSCTQRRITLVYTKGAHSCIYTKRELTLVFVHKGSLLQYLYTRAAYSSICTQGELTLVFVLPRYSPPDQSPGLGERSGRSSPSLARSL